LVFEAGHGVEDYSLCYLSVTLPTDKTPRLRLRRGDETLGVCLPLPKPTFLIRRLCPELYLPKFTENTRF
jgi:hypothetical protein